MNPALRSLASGSSGNCHLLRGPQGDLLIDAGLSRRELLRRMELCAQDPGRLRAILVSHEHGDHLGCAPVLARQLKIPVLLSRGTHAASRSRWKGSEDLVFVSDGDTWEAAGFRVRAFAVPHDAQETLQYRVDVAGSRFAVCTDLGRPDPDVIRVLQGCQILVLEANHCPELLEKGPYPWPLKQRIRGPRGHLSNQQCASILNELAGKELEHVLLAHLSKENNRPSVALETVRAGLAEAHQSLALTVAAPDKPGPWLEPRASVQPDAVDAFVDLPLFS